MFGCDRVFDEYYSSLIEKSSEQPYEKLDAKKGPFQFRVVDKLSDEYVFIFSGKSMLEFKQCANTFLRRPLDSEMSLTLIKILSRDYQTGKIKGFKIIPLIPYKLSLSEDNFFKALEFCKNDLDNYCINISPFKKYN